MQVSPAARAARAPFGESSNAIEAAGSQLIAVQVHGRIGFAWYVGASAGQNSEPLDEAAGCEVPLDPVDRRAGRQPDRDTEPIGFVEKTFDTGRKG